MKEQNFGPIRFVPGSKGGRYPNCHSVLVEEAGVLIDPGSDRGRLAELREENKVSSVWLTHWHEDHISHLDLFEDLPLYTSREAAEPLKDLDVFMDAYGMEQDLKDMWRPLMEEQFHFRPRQPEGYLEAGASVDLGPVTVDIIDTPGHSVGHLSFYFKEPDVLLTGDYDLTKFGPWYGDLGSSIEQTLDSIERLKEAGAGTYLTSHEDGVFIDPDKSLWDKYAGEIYRREEKILDLLSSPQTIESLVENWILYGKPREPIEFYKYGERVHIIKHLKRLIARGRAVSDGTKFKRV